MSLHVGEAVGDYRVIGIIGAGGMGQVFQVEHKITKRKEAMKVLIADLADDTQVQRFKREIEVQARLNHPNIAAVHNAFRLKDRMVLVLEFVEGQTLENLLKQGRPPVGNGNRLRPSNAGGPRLRAPQRCDPSRCFAGQPDDHRERAG